MEGPERPISEMKRTIGLVVMLAAVSASAVGAASMTIAPGSKLYIEPSAGFEAAIQAAFMKKKVPVVIVAEEGQADFVLKVPRTNASQEKTATRVAKLFLFGGFAGCGSNFNADASIFNQDGILIWAKTANKCDFKKAAEELAKSLSKFIKDGKVK